MRVIDTSAISDTVGMPGKAGVFDHIQLAYQEILNALAFSLVGPTYLTDTAYILYGCINSGSGLDYDISAGAIFYNNEVYLVQDTAFTAAGGQVAVAAIEITQFGDSGRGDPIQFTDGISRNVLNISEIVFASGSTGSTLFDLTDCLQTSITLVNDQEASFGSSYVVKFNQDKSVFFTAASSNCTISFDFTNAIPGAVVRLKWTFSGSQTLTITGVSGQTILKESGDLGLVGTNTNLLTMLYAGKNELGNDEVSYVLSQAV